MIPSRIYFAVSLLATAVKTLDLDTITENYNQVDVPLPALGADASNITVSG